MHTSHFIEWNLFLRVRLTIICAEFSVTGFRWLEASVWFRWWLSTKETPIHCSSPPGTLYMCQWTAPALIQVTACRLFGAKSLPETTLTYCQLDILQWNTNRDTKLYIHGNAHKTSSAKWRPFYQVGRWNNRWWPSSGKNICPNRPECLKSKIDIFLGILCSINSKEYIYICIFESVLFCVSKANRRTWFKMHENVLCIYVKSFKTFPIVTV